MEIEKNELNKILGCYQKWSQNINLASFSLTCGLKDLAKEHKSRNSIFNCFEEETPEITLFRKLARVLHVAVSISEQLHELTKEQSKDAIKKFGESLDETVESKVKS